MLNPLHLHRLPFKVALFLAVLVLVGGSILVYVQDQREKAAVTAEDVFAAVLDGDLSRIVSCLQARPDLVNARDKSGHTPLQIAAERNLAETAGVLLNLGADPCLKAPDGRTAADLAREKGSSAVLAILQEKAGAR